MSEYNEVMATIAVYLILAASIWLVGLVGWLTVKAKRAINKLDNILTYIQENEEDARKYR